MLEASTIREQIIRLLEREISLEQFEDWFVPASWNMHLDSSLSDQELASEIELRLAEHSNGHLSEDQLRADLGHFVSNYSVDIFPETHGWSGASYSVRVGEAVPVREESSDMPLAGGLVWRLLDSVAA
jgi:hypothetical protein